MSVRRCAGPIPPSIDAYFAATAAERMDHMDEHMRGRMLASVYELLLIEDEAEERAFDFEIGNHDAYGARDSMYRDLFTSSRGAARRLRRGLGRSGRAPTRSQTLLAAIDRVAGPGGVRAG